MVKRVAFSALAFSAILGFVGLSPVEARQAAAGQGTTTIATPRSNRVLGSGDVRASGRYSTTGVGQASIVYVVDLSGSTGSSAGDCSGDGAVDSNDDPNGDGNLGTVLDCEIIAVNTLHTQVTAALPSTPSAVVGFADSAAVADVDSSPGSGEADQVVRAGYDGPDDRDRQPDIINVVSALREGSVPLFTNYSVGGGTDFESAVSGAADVFGLDEFASENRIVIFISDGQSSISASNPDVQALQAGGRVYAYGVGAGTAGCAADQPLAIIAGDPSRCTLVTDPTQLALQIGVTGASVQVELQGPTPVSTSAAVSAFGNWQATLPNLQAGSYTLTATGPDGPPAVSTFKVIAKGNSKTYVALGDSYSAGEGEDPWRTKDAYDDDCHRSPKGYPLQVRDGSNGTQFATAAVSKDLFTFVACAGATTREILQREQYSGMGRQLDYLGPDVDLVTLTIGGNDVEFAQIAKHCVTSTDCFDVGFAKFNSGRTLTLREYVKVRLALLAAQLPPNYRAISDATDGNAKIVVGGYPDLFHPNPQVFCSSRAGIGGEERGFLLEANGKLDEVLEAATEVAGVRFKSVRDQFRNNLPCGPNTPEYLNPHTNADSSSRLHPTAAGYKRYAELFSDEVGSIPDFGGPVGSPEPVSEPIEQTVIGDTVLEGVEIGDDGGLTFASWITDALQDAPPSISVEEAEALLTPDVIQPLDLAIEDDPDAECDSVVAGQTVVATAPGYAPGSTATIQISGPDQAGLTEASAIAQGNGDIQVRFVAPDIGTDTLLQVEVAGATPAGLSHLSVGSLLVPGTELTCPNTEPPPHSGSTSAFVKAAYADFLRRPPTATELSTAVQAIDTQQESRRALLDRLAASPEWVDAIVKRMYRDTLGREGEPGGVSFWSRRIQDRRLTVADVAGQLYASNEYFSGTGQGNTRHWITDLYQKLLHRSADAGGVSHWLEATNRRGRTAVAVTFFQSNESRRQRVLQLYRVLLGRDPDPNGWNHWTAAIRTSGDITLAVDLAQSDEYLNRAQGRFPA